MNKKRSTPSCVRRALRDVSEPERIPVLQRFFKTGPGEYAEGDRFIGVTVPSARSVAKAHVDLPLSDVCRLLRSRIHEERLLALLMLVHRYARADAATREEIYQLYVTHFDWINNWDLVDLTAEHIVGAHLLDRDRAPLLEWARSSHLWTRRIAVLSTFHFIKRRQFDDTLRLAALLLDDEHDLIHKAVGWMLREIGNRDLAVEERFLKSHYKRMPRTMLRYAIERFPEPRRQAYLKGQV